MYGRNTFNKISQTIAVSLLSSFTTAIATTAIFSSMFVPKADYDILMSKMETLESNRIEVVQAAEIEPEETLVVEDMVLSESINVVETQIDIPVPEPVVKEIPTESYSLTQEEIDLIALVVMAEAEGEPEEGKRLVIDTILNRVDGKYWPDTVTEVIYQPHQFTSMWNGRADRCYVKEDIVELVKEELISRYNYDCVFFRTTHYSQYGVPMFQVGHHYFSSYD